MAQDVKRQGQQQFEARKQTAANQRGTETYEQVRDKVNAVGD